jgi:hypothetical protein
MGATRMDQLVHPGDLMSGKVVHEQNIPGLESWDDALFDIAIKDCAIDRSRQHQGCGDLVAADDCQGRGLRSRRMGHTLDHALVRCGTPIQACQVDVDTGFIEKFEVFHIQRADFFPKPAALAFHLRCVSLAGMKRLFFRGNFSRTNSRHTMLVLDLIFVFFSTASHSSCKVASGCAFTAARRAPSAGANWRDGPPAYGKGAQLPLFRYRATQRSMDGSLTLYRRAASGILHSPLSTLATTRSRRSVEYAFIPHIMPSKN